MLTAIVSPSLAHDPYLHWKNKGGTDCCHNKDCRQARAWLDDDGRWRVIIHGEEYIIPEYAILDIPSPDGNSHVCERTIWNKVYILCFVRGEVKS